MRRGGILRGSRDVVVRLGRMTVEDVAQLGQVFVQVASRQAGDALRGARAGSSKRPGRA